MPNHSDNNTYQMLWNCPTCGQEKLLGVTHRYCPGCGSPQDPNARYFPSDDEKIAVEDHQFVGKDLTCPACDTPNSASSSHCISCGCPLDESEAVKTQEDIITREGENYQASSKKHSSSNAAHFLNSNDQPPSNQPPKKNRSTFIIGILALIGLCLYGLYSCKSESQLQVTQMHWKRTIDIERLQAVQESNWCNQMPGGASPLQQSSKVKTYKKIPDGESCSTRRIDNGDGTYREQLECEPKYIKKPVYAPWCTYSINRWQVQRTQVNEGHDIHQLSWPNYILASKGNCLGCEREGRKKQVYSIELTDNKGKTHRCEFSEQQWAQFSKNSRWTATSNMLTGIDCGSLTLTSQ